MDPDLRTINADLLHWFNPDLCVRLKVFKMVGPAAIIVSAVNRRCVFYIYIIIYLQILQLQQREVVSIVCRFHGH